MNNNSNIPMAQFLISYLRDRSVRLHSFERNMTKIYFVRSILLMITFSFLLPSFKYKKKKYLISKHQLIDLFSKCDIDEIVIAGGWRELIFAIKYRTGFINTSLLYIAITSYCFISPKIRIFYTSSFRNLMSKLVKMSRNSLIFIDSDGLPYQRTLCVAAQQAGAKVVCVQHGIFHEAFFGIDGSLSDLNIAIDEIQLNLFLRSGIPNERLILHEKIARKENITLPCQTHRGRRVVLVGEGWWSHDPIIHQLYHDTLVKLKRELSHLGIITFFRPHPSERFAVWRYIRLFPIMLAGRSKNIVSTDIYIGATSSLLVESAKIGGVSIQITDVLGIGSSLDEYGVIRCAADTTAAAVEKILTNSFIESGNRVMAVRAINPENILWILNRKND